MREHPIFERDGAHLSCEVPVSFVTAALGGTVEVPTLDGEVTIKVPAGTQSGRVFRLRDKGVKPVRGGAPAICSAASSSRRRSISRSEQRELLRKFEDSLSGDGKRHNPAREARGFEGVKRFFSRIGKLT